MSKRPACYEYEYPFTLLKQLFDYLLKLDERATQKTSTEANNRTNDSVEPAAKKARKSSAKEELKLKDKESSNVREDDDSDEQQGATSSQSVDHSMESIEVTLEGRELWNRFNELGTEMIITKCGR